MGEGWRGVGSGWFRVGAQSARPGRKAASEGSGPGPIVAVSEGARRGTPWRPPEKEWKDDRPPHPGMGENLLRADSDPPVHASAYAVCGWQLTGSRGCEITMILSWEM